MKTKKCAVKRMKLSANGKLMRSQGGKAHLNNGKTRARKRSLRGKKIALTLGVKEYGGRRLPYSIVCSKVKDINIFYEKTDETTPLNVSTLSDGSYYVALPVFGLEFVCAKIEEGK